VLTPLIHSDLLRRAVLRTLLELVRHSVDRAGMAKQISQWPTIEPSWDLQDIEDAEFLAELLDIPSRNTL
jgi:hypothetical protein